MNVGALKIADAVSVQQKSTAIARPLHVLLLAPNPAVPGGMTVFLETMVAHLARARVAFMWTGSVPSRREYPLALLWRVLSAPVSLLWRLRCHSYDVVHINPCLNLKSVVRDGLMLSALRLMGFRRTLVYFHGYDVEFAARLRDIPVARHIFAWAVNGAACVTTLSQECRDLLVELGVEPDKILCTRTMFDGALLKAVQPANAQRRMILYMSRFERGKGVYELLDAFARIAADFPDADLVMAGDGLENDALKVRAASYNLGARIAFPGYVVGEEKAKLLMGCTVFVLPTAAEGMPVALLEAMGAGKLLITTQAGGIAHIVRAPENGVVLAEVSAETVEAALRRVLGDPEYCRAVGEHNAQYAWSRFEAGVVTPEIETLYQRVARV